MEIFEGETTIIKEKVLFQNYLATALSIRWFLLWHNHNFYFGNFILFIIVELNLITIVGIII